MHTVEKAIHNAIQTVYGETLWQWTTVDSLKRWKCRNLLFSLIPIVGSSVRLRTFIAVKVFRSWSSQTTPPYASPPNFLHCSTLLYTCLLGRKDIFRGKYKRHGLTLHFTWNCINEVNYMAGAENQGSTRLCFKVYFEEASRLPASFSKWWCPYGAYTIFGSILAASDRIMSESVDIRPRGKLGTSNHVAEEDCKILSDPDSKEASISLLVGHSLHNTSFPLL